MRLATCPVLIIGLLVGFVIPTRAQVPTINIDKTCQAAGWCDSQPAGRKTHSRARRHGMLGLRTKGPRTDHQGPRNLFGRRQETVHTNRCLSAELRGMAHLPGDGKARERDEAGTAACDARNHAAKGTSGYQLLTSECRLQLVWGRPCSAGICPGAVTCPADRQGHRSCGAGATSNLAGAAWRQSSLNDGAETSP